MDTFLLIIRILLLIIGSIIGIGYVLYQFYQKVGTFSFELSTVDYIIYVVIALLFGFGTNSYWGLCAFVPLILIKFICRYYIQPRFLYNSGRWMEVNWKRLLPKGFERILPPAALAEMSRMPKDAHFVIPKLYFSFFIKFMRKKLQSEASKGSNMNLSAAQQNMGMSQFNQLIDSLQNLQPHQTETKTLPFGILKVTRL